MVPNSRSRIASSAAARTAPRVAVSATAGTLRTDSYCLSASARQSKQPARRLASAWSSAARAAIAGSTATFFGPQATAKALDHCLGALKLSGIKLHPEIEFFDPNEEELMEPVYEAARRYHVPVIFHTGMSSKAAPAVIAELASKYPDVPVILGHMGVSEYVKQAVAVARQNDNIYLETSVVGWMPLIMEAFNRVGTSKMLYGSDHPYNPLPMEVEKIARHAARAAKLTKTDLRALFSRNILAILNPNRR